MDSTILLRRRFWLSTLITQSLVAIGYFQGEQVIACEIPICGSQPNLIAQQPDPNRDRQLPPLVTPDLKPLDSTPVLIPPSTDQIPSFSDESQPEVTPPVNRVPISVMKVEVKGSTVFKPEAFASLVSPLEGKTVYLEDLQKAADAITQLYLNKGYLTSRAIVVEQEVKDGIVQIQVVEGKLSDIKIEGTKRLSHSYIRSRLKIGANVPLRPSDLENQLRLLKTDPLLKNIEATLRPGEANQGSILLVRVTEAHSFILNLFSDNYSPPSVGSERYGFVVGNRNLGGLGDEITFNFNRTAQGGATAYGFNYALPVNGRDGKLQLRAAFSNTNVIDDNFSFLGITGNTSLYEIGFRQPVIRTPRQELGLTLGFTYERGQTFLFEDQPFPFGIGPDDNGVSATSVVKFAQDYVLRDRKGAWALRSQFNVGTGLFDATQNPAPIPDGQFFSWQGQFQRVQTFGGDRTLILSLDTQLTPNTLLPQQQFVIGGGQSLRGYRQNARSGDNGVRFSGEMRFPLQRNEAGKPIFQVAPFFDAGGVWNQADNPNQQQSQRFLAAAGLGLIWEVFPKLNLRLDYAYPFIDLSDRGNNIQESALYFSVNFNIR